MRTSILETIRQWAATLHDDLVALREETKALRDDVRGLTLLVSEVHQETVRLRVEINRLKEFYPDEEEEQESPWKM